MIRDYSQPFSVPESADLESLVLAKELQIKDMVAKSILPESEIVNGWLGDPETSYTDTIIIQSSKTAKVPVTNEILAAAYHGYKMGVLVSSLVIENPDADTVAYEQFSTSLPLDDAVPYDIQKYLSVRPTIKRILNEYALEATENKDWQSLIYGFGALALLQVELGAEKRFAIQSEEDSLFYALTANIANDNAVQESETSDLNGWFQPESYMSVEDTAQHILQSPEQLEELDMRIASAKEMADQDGGEDTAHTQVLLKNIILNQDSRTIAVAQRITRAMYELSRSSYDGENDIIRPHFVSVLKAQKMSWVKSCDVGKEQIENSPAIARLLERYIPTLCDSDEYSFAWRYAGFILYQIQTMRDARRANHNDDLVESFANDLEDWLNGL